jgi:2-polyprenyl-3-methyl-5-hydroxy-6-metoxy-1,4-benzoquinol methylase
LDPLNSWSRVWEYPFVAEQLRRYVVPRHGLRLLDIGTAVTFFPFYLGRQGFEVTMLDADPQMPEHFQRAFDRTSKKLGVKAQPRYVIADARDTKLPDASFDVITCISVLEHIPEWTRSVNEISRLLRPNGLFVLTFDVEHSGNTHALPATESWQLLQTLSGTMQMLTFREERVPEDALTPFNRIWHPRMTHAVPLYKRIFQSTSSKHLGPISKLPRRIVNRLRRVAARQEPAGVDEDICVFGGVWRKHSIE